MNVTLLCSFDDRPQHLTGLQLVKDLCQGALEGASEDSTEIAFHPGELSAGDYVADTKTAGSVYLAFIVMLFSFDILFVLAHMSIVRFVLAACILLLFYYYYYYCYIIKLF